ncbi:ferritin-like domain-containing protein [Sphingomonas sp. A2-49]|uniref:ferritin-like domain-containing protein n=1 Tax=Sphingomonas sp. A2-49 TaxID=1391375 RepID=UPI0021CF6C89|nr:ferritin-like domain-containing protein [Sphingomonas sp. A2-49]MCU6454437.1 ferritin-like domain-containing protein [Sphingomonas sp. A2-49]
MTQTDQMSDQIIEAFDARARRREERRGFFKNAMGMAAVTAAGAAAMSIASDAAAQTTGPSEVDVLNFALNLEYLEAQFYSYAATGQGLPNSLLTGGVGTQGAVVTGTGAGSARKVAFADPAIAAYAREIAADEVAHVTFLRAAIRGTSGSDALIAAQPAINISGAAGGAFFAAAAAASPSLAGFDPYADDNSFLLAAFVFEDVGVTAYKGAAGALINNKTYLEAAAGILAVEAYHAAIVRTALYARGLAVPSLRTTADTISNLRDSVDGSTDLDQGISPVTNALGVVSNIVPLDNNGLAFSRTPAQVLNVVYLTNKSVNSGGFFPSGINNGNTALRSSGAN